jgi:hypothetical protein
VPANKSSLEDKKRDRANLRHLIEAMETWREQSAKRPMPGPFFSFVSVEGIESAKAELAELEREIEELEKRAKN